MKTAPLMPTISSYKQRFIPSSHSQSKSQTTTQQSTPPPHIRKKRWKKDYVINSNYNEDE